MGVSVGRLGHRVDLLQGVGTGQGTTDRASLAASMDNSKHSRAGKVRGNRQGRFRGMVLLKHGAGGLGTRRKGLGGLH